MNICKYSEREKTMNKIDDLNLQDVNNHTVFTTSSTIAFEDQYDGFSFYVMLDGDVVVDYSDIYELPKWCREYLEKKGFKIDI